MGVGAQNRNIYEIMRCVFVKIYIIMELPCEDILAWTSELWDEPAASSTLVDAIKIYFLHTKDEIK